MEKDFLRKGYVMVSRALLMSMCEKQGPAQTEEEAFIRVLVHVNFKDAAILYNGEKLKCARGESIISFLGWSHILGWKRGHTRRFFERNITEGLIESVSDACPSHIRIPGYDAWTGTPAGVKKPGNAEKKEKEDGMREELKRFIARYSATTHLPPDSLEHALLFWKKLSTAERNSAFEHIDDYYYGLENTMYCCQASKYLENKVFNNDFPKRDPSRVR